jgi:hypothetical protein
MISQVAVFVLTLMPTVVGEKEIAWFSQADSRQFVVTITNQMIENSPVWADDDENPPLSARDAIKRANEIKNKLVQDSEMFKWKLASASLTPAKEKSKKWYWLIYYKAEFQGINRAGYPDDLRLVVLMDGTVISPVIKAHAPKN